MVSCLLISTQATLLSSILHLVACLTANLSVASLNPSSSTYIALVKVFFFSLKVLIFFLFLYENICCDTH